MYVEDLFLKIRDTIIGITQRHLRPFDGMFDDDWHSKFIRSIGDTMDQSKPLSTKQSAAVLKLIGRCRSYLVSYGFTSTIEIDRLLSAPMYRQELYESTYVPKEARHLGGNLLAFRFKKNDTLRDEIKALGDIPRSQWLTDVREYHRHYVKQPEHFAKSRYNWIYRLWIVPVHRFNLGAITNLIAKEHINLDEPATSYLKLSRRSLDKPSLFAVDEDNEIILVNVCDDPLLSAWMIEIANGVAL